MFGLLSFSLERERSGLPKLVVSQYLDLDWCCPWADDGLSGVIRCWATGEQTVIFCQVLKGRTCAFFAGLAFYRTRCMPPRKKKRTAVCRDLTSVVVSHSVVDLVTNKHLVTSSNIKMEKKREVTRAFTLA